MVISLQGNVSGDIHRTRVADVLENRDDITRLGGCSGGVERLILRMAVCLLNNGSRSVFRRHGFIGINRIEKFRHIGAGVLEDADTGGSVAIVDIVVREVYLGAIGEVIALKLSLFSRAGHLVAGYGRREVNIRSTLDMDKALGGDGIRIGGRFLEGVPGDCQYGTGNGRELDGIPVAVRERAIGHRCGSAAVNRG